MTAPGYSAKRLFRHTFISGYDLNTNNEPAGWKFESYCNKYFILTENNVSRTFIIDDVLPEDTWYSFVLNYSAQFGQINFNIFEISDDRRNISDLKTVFTKTLNNITSEDKTTEYPFRLIGSNHHQTNLRIFNKCIPQEQCSTILNQYLVDDSHYALLVDNAIPVLKIPFLGPTK
jgi:hypothetical protein